jgi:hypothetical protein
MTSGRGTDFSFSPANSYSTSMVTRSLLSSSACLGLEERKRKRSPVAVSAPEPAIDKATVDDLWAQFNNPLDDPYARPRVSV